MSWGKLVSYSTYTLIDYTVYCKIKVFPSLAPVNLCLLLAISCLPCFVFAVFTVFAVLAEFTVLSCVCRVCCLPCLLCLPCLCLPFTLLSLYVFAVFAVSKSTIQGHLSRQPNRQRLCLCMDEDKLHSQQISGTPLQICFRHCHDI